jgi:hypothetical protein
VLPEGCVIADAGVLRGRRFGNLVVLGGRTPAPLPELTRRAAGDWFPARVEPDLERFSGGAAPVHDDEAVASPAPPEGLFSSRSSRGRTEGIGRRFNETRPQVPTFRNPSKE